MEMALIPRLWRRPQRIVDEEQFMPFAPTVDEPQALDIFLYMTNGTAAILHVLLQGQINAKFVPVLVTW